MITTLHIRWLIRRDMPEVLGIERTSQHPWSEEDFLTILRNKNIIGMVVEVGERVVGFMVYALELDHLYVLNFAVHPESRRQGVGRCMVEKLIGKLSGHRRTKIGFCVREGNLSAQLFLRAQRFLCVDTLYERYEDTGEDGYLFEYCFKEVGHDLEG